MKSPISFISSFQKDVRTNGIKEPNCEVQWEDPFSLHAALAQHSPVSQSEPSVTAGPGERWCVVAPTRPPGAGAGSQAGSGCRRAPEETVVLGDFFVCLLNYLLEWI